MPDWRDLLSDEPEPDFFKLGMTGSQTGVTALQERALGQLIIDLQEEFGLVEFHHGDCIGADAGGHDVAKRLGCKTVLHPPTTEAKRAFCEADEVRKPAPYLDRNHDIVDEADCMIALPDKHEVLRSGTWATVRYAKKHGKELVVVYPDGSLERWHRKDEA